MELERRSRDGNGSQEEEEEEEIVRMREEEGEEEEKRGVERRLNGYNTEAAIERSMNFERERHLYRMHIIKRSWFNCDID